MMIEQNEVLFAFQVGKHCKGYQDHVYYMANKKKKYENSDFDCLDAPNGGANYLKMSQRKQKVVIELYLMKVKQGRVHPYCYCRELSSVPADPSDEKPHISNSIEQEFSLVNLRTYTKFLIIEGATRTLVRDKGRVFDRKEKEPVVLIGMLEPLAILTDFPVRKLKVELRLPADFARCAVAPESMYHWWSLGSNKVIVLKDVAK